jgi:hypothetical protein
MWTMANERVSLGNKGAVAARSGRAMKKNRGRVAHSERSSAAEQTLSRPPRQKRPIGPLRPIRRIPTRRFLWLKRKRLAVSRRIRPVDIIARRFGRLSH